MSFIRSGSLVVMDNIKCLRYLGCFFSFFFILVLVVTQPIEEKFSHEDISESVAEAKSKQREAKKRIEEAKKKQEEAKTERERNDAELREQYATNDFYEAQIQEQKGVLELANQANDTEAIDKAQQQIEKTRKEQKKVEQKISKLSQQLAKEFVPEKVAAITSDSDLRDYTQSLEIGGYSHDVAEKKVGYLNEIYSKIQEFFDDSVIDKELATKQTSQDKLDFLDTKRMILEDLLDITQQELNKLNKWAESHEVPNVSKEYKRSLEDTISLITQKKAKLDVTRVSLELKNVSLFSRIVSAIKDWFDRTFEFHKTPWYKRSIDVEISNLKEIKQQVSRMQQGNIRNFSDRVYDISDDIEALENQFKDYKAGKSSLDFDQFRENVAALQKQLEGFDIEEAQDAVDVFNTLYAESLQPMLGDMSAKLRRYKGTEFATLFDQMADYYASGSIFGNTAYKSEQAYQALFTPEVIDKLNAKNPGLNLTRAMFDPVSFNPESISPELIDQAYKESHAIYTQQDPVWRAARNASFLLRNPVGRATYDSFLEDYKNLLAKNLLAKGIKDHYKNKTGTKNNFLNNKGALSKLQITEATKNQIEPLQQKIIDTIVQTRSYFDGVVSSITTLDTKKQVIQALGQDVFSFAQRQEQSILGGNS